MLTFITIVHLVLALVLVSLVLLQDSKGGAMGFTGGGANQVLSATGATNILVKITRFTAIAFAITSIALTWQISHGNKSVTDQFAPAAVTAPAATAGATDTQAAPATDATTTPPSSTPPSSATPEKK